MSARDGFVAVPVDLGQALAFPEVYMEWPAALLVPEPALRVRRPGRVRRKLAALASVAVAAGLALAGTADGTRKAPRRSRGRRAASVTGGAR